MPQQKKKAKRRKLLTLLLVLSLPYLAVSLSNNGFLGLLPFVREDFGLSRTQVGSYYTFFFISAAVLAVFTGDVVDRLGPKRGILFGLGCMGAAMFLYGLAPSYVALLALAFVAGLGFSIITPSVNKGVLMGAPPGKRAVSMGVMQSGLGIGGFAGASLLPSVGRTVGWRVTIQGAALFSILAAGLVLLFYHPERPAVYADESGTSSLRRKVLALLSDARLLKLCVVGLIYASVTSASLSHYTVFLSEDLQLSAALAGLGLGIMHIGGIGGRPLWGWLSDNLFGRDRRLTMCSVGVAIGALYLLLGSAVYLMQLPTAAIYVLSVLLGVSVLSWLGIYFVAIGEIVGEGQTGMATGVALVFSRMGILVAAPVFGWMADATGTYQLSWLVFGAVILATAALYQYSKPG